MIAKEIKITRFNSPYGKLIIGTYNNQLCVCDWQHRKQRQQIDARIQKSLQASFIEKPCDVATETIKQLDEYFTLQRKTFDLPLLLVGTEFQQKVWSELLKIEYAHTSTYLKQAERVGNTLSIRAVASANGANALSIIVPCHRIIGTDNSLIGYAGGLDAKEKLLRLENPNFNLNNQLSIVY